MSLKEIEAKMTELKKNGSSGDAEKLRELREDMETKLEKTKEDLKKMAGTKTGGAATNAEVKDTLREMRRKQQLTEIMRFSMNVVTFGWGSTEADEREKMLKDYCKEKEALQRTTCQIASNIRGRREENSAE